MIISSWKYSGHTNKSPSFKIFPHIFILDLSNHEILRFHLLPCLSFLVIFVRVATSLLQSSSGSPDAISIRSHYHPFIASASVDCLLVSAVGFQYDVTVKRETQSSGTRLPCGVIKGGGQSSPFSFENDHGLRLQWSFTEAKVHRERVVIREVNLEGKDRLIRSPRVEDIGITFSPHLGKSYIIQLTGTPIYRIGWFFSSL